MSNNTGRILPDQFEDNLDIHNKDVNVPYVPFGEKINVYKFRKVSGITQFTTFGEKDKPLTSNEINQIVSVYTGREPLTVLWEGSTNLSVDESDDSIIKTYQNGKYEECYWASSTSNEISNQDINLLNVNYNAEFIKKTISLVSVKWEPTTKDQLDYFYLIIDKRANIFQWLELTSYSRQYNEETKLFVKSDLEFETVNLKYSATGKSILDFIQFGGIGEGYAFPIEHDGEVYLDTGKMFDEDKTTNEIQLDYTGGAALSSMLIIGRPASVRLTGEANKLKMYKPQRLWLWKSQIPKESAFLYNKPNSNFYIANDARPNKEGVWASYREHYKGDNSIGNYNTLDTKTVQTGLDIDKAKVQATNPNGNTYTSWGNNGDEAVIKVPDGSKLEPIPSIKNKPIDRTCTYADFLNVNSMINWYVDVFDYDYKETTKYKLKDVLGVLGGVVNVLVGGLDIGWTTSKSSIELKQQMNLMIPTISYQDGFSGISGITNLPLDVFNEDKSKNVLATSSNVMTSLNFTLTDMVQDTSLVIAGAEIGKGGDGIWNLKYWGQKTDEKGNNLLASGEAVEFDMNNTSAYEPTTNQFIIDYIIPKTISNSDLRISAYNRSGDTVYTALLETNSKVVGDLRLWSNPMKFNYYDEFNTLGQVNWPQTVEPPEPPLPVDSWDSGVNFSSNVIYQMPKKLSKPDWNITTKFLIKADLIHGTSYYKATFYIEFNGKRINFGDLIAAEGTKNQEPKIVIQNAIKNVIVPPEASSTNTIEFSFFVDEDKWNKPRKLDVSVDISTMAVGETKIVERGSSGYSLSGGKDYTRPAGNIIYKSEPYLEVSASGYFCFLFSEFESTITVEKKNINEYSIKCYSTMDILDLSFVPSKIQNETLMPYKDIHYGPGDVVNFPVDDFFPRTPPIKATNIIFTKK